jgi:hypothetical protein
MKVEEIETDSNAAPKFDYPRHEIEVPELSYSETFYPLGFPTDLRTNSTEIFALARDLWRGFEKRFDTEPIRVDVHIVDVPEGAPTECPPMPVIRIMHPLLVNIADPDNYSIADLERCTTQITLSRSTERHRSYLDYFFLGCAPYCHIASRYTTPIHAGCVAFNGRGMLLCGESGAGKSSLSYACAQAGWTYITDDASYLLNEGQERLITGNCHQVRFRPSAAVLFPEVEGLDITPRAAGKPSIELPTASMPGMICSPTARADFVVFLNRRRGHATEIVPYSKEAARDFMRKVLFGPEKSRAVQHAALERLLKVEVLELRYSDLDRAVHRMETLAREGR